MTTITTASDPIRIGWWRGDYIGVHNTVADQPQPKRRVIAVSGPTLTVRNVHRWRWVEWCHARLEDRIVWPLSDLRKRLRTPR